MFRIFRHFRRSLLPGSIYGKYFLYAIGEIILVVLGILIALYVDNRNDEIKSEERIAGIFEEILNELSKNIDETSLVMEHYFMDDSLSQAVITNTVTYETLKNPAYTYGFRNIILDVRGFVFTQVGFEKLMRSSDPIPEKYETVVRELNTLREYYAAIGHAWEGRSEMSDLVSIEWAENYEWYYKQVWPWDNEGLLDYMANNFRYKNNVRLMLNIKEGTLGNTIGYRNQAIKCYNLIAEQLGLPGYESNLGISEPRLREIEGVYQYSDDRTGNIEALISSNGRLWFINIARESLREGFVLSHSRFLFESSRYATLQYSDNGIPVFKFNRPFELRKIRPLNDEDINWAESLLD